MWNPSDEEEPLPGVRVGRLRQHTDPRGWLVELFREDELPVDYRPVMAYISVTHPGQSRGPHEHREQTDWFAFLSGEYEVVLWENRPGLPEKEVRVRVGEANPSTILIPPGVVHAYKNVGAADAYVINLPDRLYAGRGKQEPVDEIRHENDPQSRFKI